MELMSKSQCTKTSSSSFRIPWNIPNTKYTLSVLPSGRIAEAMTVLAKTWTELEPMSLWSRISWSNLRDIFVSIQSDSLLLGPMLSLIVTDPAGRIVGAGLNRHFGLDHVQPYDGPLVHLWTELENRYRAHYLVEKHEGLALYIDSIGVADEAKGRGLAEVLVRGAMVLGKTLGYSWAVIEATNVYSARVCEKLGLERISQIVYDEFEYHGKYGKQGKVFKGLDKFFTNLLNKKRPKDKQLTSAANACVLFEGNIRSLKGGA